MPLLYGSIFVKEIDRIAEHIRKVATPEEVEKLKNQFIKNCFIIRGIGGCLCGLNLKGPYSLHLGVKNEAYDILTTMMHELFHIPFLLSKILPGTQWDLDESHKEFLEHTIQMLAEEFVQKNADWTAAKFKEWLGQDHTEFPCSIQPQAVT